eukprot:PITA_36339
MENAVHQLKEGKASRPDGFTSNFFHNFWELIKLEVWQIFEESRTMRWILLAMNATSIALIPKEDHSNTPDKFLPIALCNVIYKIVSKIVASRLKSLLPLLISPEQSRYVEGKQITDGIILTEEIIHSLKHSKKSAFLGYQTGGPSFPFLFVLMAEGLGRSIKASLFSQKLRGLSFPNTPAFTHQKFVDDNMLFGHPSIHEARQFNSPLTNFLEASGAKINKAKSQIFFFHTPAVTKASIVHIPGFSIVVLPSKYLGTPMTDSTMKNSSWRMLLEKLEARLSSWTHRALNMASRLVLIKAVLQSMPLYLFLILATPKWVLKEIKRLQRSFLSCNPDQKHNGP